MSSATEEAGSGSAEDTSQDESVSEEGTTTSVEESGSETDSLAESSSSGESSSSSDEAPAATSAKTSIAMTKDAMEVLTMDKDLIPIAKKKNAEYIELKKKKSSKIKFGGYSLYPWQYVASQTFLTTTGITELLADKSAGKTLFAAAVARSCQRCLIIGTGGSFTASWPTMLGSYGMYAGKISESTVALFNPSAKTSHWTHLTEDKISSREQLIVVCKVSNTQEVMDKVFKRKGVSMEGLEFTVIVDEAHKKSEHVLNYILPLLYATSGVKVTRVLLMTGSPIDAKKIGFEKKINEGADPIGYTISHHIKVSSEISEDLPRENWRIDIMDAATYSGGEAEWNSTIKEITDKHKKVVIYCEEPLVRKDSALVTSKALKGKNVIILKGAKGTLDNFNNSKRGVLIVSKTKSESLNILAEAMIYFNPGYKQTNDQVIQTAKRIVRSESPYKKGVYIYALVSNLTEYLRIYYASRFSYPGWGGAFAGGIDKDVNASMVYKALGLIRALGADPNTISQADGCIILANYPAIMAVGGMTDPVEDTIAWWKIHCTVEKSGQETILTEDMIKDTVFWV